MYDTPPERGVTLNDFTGIRFPSGALVCGKDSDRIGTTVWMEREDWYPWESFWERLKEVSPGAYGTALQLYMRVGLVPTEQYNDPFPSRTGSPHD